MGGKHSVGSGQRSKPAGLINLSWIHFIIPFIRTVIFKKGNSWRGNLYVICTAWCQWKFYIYEWNVTWMFVCCCNLMIFYDWRECVMSALGTTKHSSATVLTLGNEVVLQQMKHKKAPFWALRSSRTFDRARLNILATRDIHFCVHGSAWLVTVRTELHMEMHTKSEIKHEIIDISSVKREALYNALSSAKRPVASNTHTAMRTL